MSVKRGSFGKSFASLWQGSMVGQPDLQLVFLYMISNCDADGFLDQTQEVIAALTGLPVERVRAAVEILESPDARSRSKAEEGRRIVRVDDGRDWGWRIVNHGVYRQRTAANRKADYRRRRLEEVREKDRLRKRRARREGRR